MLPTTRTRIPGPIDSRIKTSLKDSLKGYWSLDAMVSNTWNDDSGNGQTLQTTTGGATNPAGKISGCAYLAGTGTPYLYTASTENLTMRTATDYYFTVSAWIYLNNLTDYHLLICKNTSGSNRLYRLWYIPNQGFNLIVFNNGTASGGATNPGNTNVTVSQWHFVVAQYDRVAQTIGVSVDGSAMATASYTGGISDNNTSWFEVGTFDEAAYAKSFYIDEIAFWKRLLTSAEITGMYNNGNGISLKGII